MIIISKLNSEDYKVKENNSGAINSPILVIEHLKLVCTPYCPCLTTIFSKEQQFKLNTVPKNGETNVKTPTERIEGE